MARPLQPAKPVRLVGVSFVCLTCLAVSGCWVDSLLTGSGCTEQEDVKEDLQEPTDPATTLKIEDCRMDVGACDALCEMVLTNNNEGSDSGNTLSGCTVTFSGSTTHVDAQYDVQSDGPGCAIPFNDDEPGPSGGL